MDSIQLPWFYDPAAGRLTWSLAALIVISVGKSHNRHIQTELTINLEVAEVMGYDVLSSETINA